MTIHLLCGVPGAGKGFVASKLTDRFAVVPHDDTRDRKLYATKLLETARTSTKPVLGDAPFGIQALIDQLESAGAEVVTHYLTGKPSDIAKRYVNRTGKPWRQQHADNLARYDARDTWHYRGSPEQILDGLSALTER